MARPKNADGQRTRQAILDAALDLFAREGLLRHQPARRRRGGRRARERALQLLPQQGSAVRGADRSPTSTPRSSGWRRLPTGPITDGRAVLEQLAIATLESFAAPRAAAAVPHPDVGRHPPGPGRAHQPATSGMGSGRERLHDIMRRLIREGWLRDGRSADAGHRVRRPADRLAAAARDRRRPADDHESARVRAAACRSVPAGRRGALGAPRASPPRGARRAQPAARHAAPGQGAVAVRSQGASFVSRLIAFVRRRRRAVGERLRPRRCRRRPRARRSRRRQRDRRPPPSSSRSRASSASAARSPRRKKPKSPPKSPAASSPRRWSAAAASAPAATSMRIAAAEVEAQAREAEANAAQIEARLGIANGARLRRRARARSGQRPRRARAGAHRVRARADAAGAAAPLAVGVRSEAARRSRRRERQYEVARNGAEQQYQALMAARARVDPGAEGARRHRRARAVRRRGRRAVRRRSATTSRAAPRWRR